MIRSSVNKWRCKCERVYHYFSLYFMIFLATTVHMSPKYNDFSCPFRIVSDNILVTLTIKITIGSILCNPINRTSFILILSAQ